MPTPGSGVRLRRETRCSLVKERIGFLLNRQPTLDDRLRGYDGLGSRRLGSGADD